MTNTQKIELVTRYLSGETIEELAAAFHVNTAAIRYNLTHIYKTKKCGRKIDIENCALPTLAKWLNDNGYSEAWLASRMGVTKQTVSHYIQGICKVVPKRRTQICNITGLKMQQAFGE